MTTAGTGEVLAGLGIPSTVSQKAAEQMSRAGGMFVTLEYCRSGRSKPPKINEVGLTFDLAFGPKRESAEQSNADKNLRCFECEEPISILEALEKYGSTPELLMSMVRFSDLLEKDHFGHLDHGFALKKDGAMNACIALDHRRQPRIATAQWALLPATGWDISTLEPHHSDNGVMPAGTKFYYLEAAPPLIVKKVD